MPSLDRVATARPEALAALYADMESQGHMTLSRVATALSATGCVPSGALQDIAQGVQSWKGHAYHGATHHAEVLLNAWRLGARDAATLLAAAGHDWGYDPTLHGGPYAQEQVATDRVTEVLRRNRCDPTLIQDVQDLILSTYPPLRAQIRARTDGLASHLVRPASILSDADLLSSAGLTRARSQLMSARLAEETGQAATPAGFVAFLDAIVGPSFLSPQSHMFTDAMQDIRAQMVKA